MEVYFDYFGRTFYVQPLLVLITVCALVISIKNHKKHTCLKYFPLYFSFYLAANIFQIIQIYILHPRLIEAGRFVSLVELISVFIEVYVFSWFFKFQLNQKVNKLINVGIFLFCCLAIICLIRDYKNSALVSLQSIFLLYTTEAFILIVISVVFFRELFSQLAVINLAKHAPFWVAMGILFTMVCTLPFSLFLNIYFTNELLASIVKWFTLFLIFYCFMFLVFIKAYTCKPVK